MKKSNINRAKVIKLIQQGKVKEAKKEIQETDDLNFEHFLITEDGIIYRDSSAKNRGKTYTKEEVDKMKNKLIVHVIKGDGEL